MRNMLFSVTVIFCILFIALAYFILYRETCRHRNMIKTLQRKLYLHLSENRSICLFNLVFSFSTTVLNHEVIIFNL